MATASPARAHTRSTSLTGRTALVLGASRARGVGAATTLAHLGAHVIVADDDGDALEAHYLDDGRFDIRPFAPASSRDIGMLAATFAQTDVLVHCADAGVGAAERSEQNGAVASCVAAIRHFAPAMMARRRGSIITISSPRPTCAGRGDGPSSSSRGPLHQLVRTFAGDMRPFGVRVNAISPHGVESSPAVAFLASDASAHVTGAVLTMEPGWSVLERLDEGQDLPSMTADLSPDTAERAPLSFPVRLRRRESATEGLGHERRRA